MGALAYYGFTIAIYTCLSAIQALGFNLQFGFAGIINLAYVVLVAVGAYSTAIAAVAPAPHGGLTQYIGGFGWPFPWDMLFGIFCTLAFSAVLGGLAFKRLREDYLAVSMIVVGAGLLVLINDDVPIFNGTSGMAGVPGPFQDQLGPEAYQFVFLMMSAVSALLIFLLFSRITKSPFGRALKAVREDSDAAASLGKSPWRLKMSAFLLGGLAAGLSGSLLILYIGAWNTSAWLPQESLIVLAAIIVGGRGNHGGAVLGTFVVIGVITQATKFIPSFGNAVLVASLQVVSIGLLILAFMWWRPQGLLPELKDQYLRVGIKKELSDSGPALPRAVD